MSLHPSVHARTTPDKVAYRMAGSGAATTYGELDRVSNEGAQLFRSLGLKPQDHIALLAENSLRFPAAPVGELRRPPSIRALAIERHYGAAAGW